MTITLAMTAILSPQFASTLEFMLAGIFIIILISERVRWGWLRKQQLHTVFDWRWLARIHIRHIYLGFWPTILLFFLLIAGVPNTPYLALGAFMLTGICYQGSAFLALRQFLGPLYKKDPMLDFSIESAYQELIEGLMIFAFGLFIWFLEMVPAYPLLELILDICFVSGTILFCIPFIDSIYTKVRKRGFISSILPEYIFYPWKRLDYNWNKASKEKRLLKIRFFFVFLFFYINSMHMFPDHKADFDFLKLFTAQFTFFTLFTLIIGAVFLVPALWEKRLQQRQQGQQQEQTLKMEP